MQRKHNTGIRKFLRTLAPDFCWLSAYDLFIMMEQIPELEDVTEECFKITLHQLKQQGLFITKKGKHREPHAERGSPGFLYLRVK